MYTSDIHIINICIYELQDINTTIMVSLLVKLKRNELNYIILSIVYLRFSSQLNQLYKLHIKMENVFFPPHEKNKPKFILENENSTPISKALQT